MPTHGDTEKRDTDGVTGKRMLRKGEIDKRGYQQGAPPGPGQLG